MRRMPTLQQVEDYKEMQTLEAELRISAPVDPTELLQDEGMRQYCNLECNG